MRKNRFYLEWALVFLVSLACAALLAKSPAGDRADNFLLDQLVALTRDEPDDQIMLVAIDEAALARFGPWPWDRRTQAQLTDRIAAGGAAVIGLDILFSEASDAAADDMLSTAIGRADNVVVPAYLHAPGTDGRAFDMAMPIAPIAAAARKIGHVNVHFDADTLVRRAHLRLSDGDRTIDHFALNLAHMADASAIARMAAPTAHRLDEGSPDIIRYHPAGSYPSISAAAVLAGELPPGLLRGKILLVGATAPGLGDSFAVPGTAGHVMAGIEIQANMVDALLHGRMIRAADGGMPLPVIAIFIALLLAAYWYLSPTASLIASGLLLIVAMAAVLAAFSIWGLWYPPSGLLLALIIVYPLWSWRRLAALDSYIQGEAATLRDSLSDPASEAGRRGMDRISASIDSLRSLVGRVQYVRGFMENTIEKAPDAMIVVDEAGQILHANPAAERLFARPLAGMALGALLPCGPADWARMDGEIALRPDCTLLARGALLDGAARSADPGTPSAIVRLIDISKMRALEAQRSEMLEFLSHDMRAPQAAILSIVGSAGAADSDPLFARIRRQAETGLKLADDFVQLARLDSSAPQTELVDLRDILDEAIDRSFPAASARGITIHRPESDEPLLVEADPWLLDRAFGNLLDNAIKFSPPGAAVRCTAQAMGDGTCRAAIADEGPGLSPERVAAPFERFGSRAADGAGGAGLGLAFVKKVIDAHGADIAVTSSAQGTTFTLTFAAATDALSD